MKKFTFQRVLDGLRSSVSQQPRVEQEIVETLRPENFQVAKVSLIHVPVWIFSTYFFAFLTKENKSMFHETLSFTIFKACS